MEKAEKRCDARVGREIVAICPHGMLENTFISEVTAFTHFLQNRFRTTVISDIHDPYKDSSSPPKESRKLQPKHWIKNHATK
jgi:hypothetical protein